MDNLPAEIERLTLDVTSDSSIQDCLAEIKERTGGTLNMLANNAGIWHTMPISDVDIKAAREVSTSISGQSFR
jgi:1-acylglycerone phosphate reductase